MKKQILKHPLSLITALLAFLLSSSSFAQQITGDVTKQDDIVPGTTVTAGAVRVIDNKGTIKYLQAKNGITLLSNTTDNVTTTTWQLGGTLTDNTYVDVDTKIFALDGIELVDPATLAASTDATDKSDHGTGTGWTILVRDEATGATKKLKASDLVQSGQEKFTTTAAQVTSKEFTLTGSPALPNYSQVWVYRNGAKLIANLDYTISGSKVTLVPQTTFPNDWQLFENDVIEVHYIK